jgi:hypothetical protein
MKPTALLHRHHGRGGRLSGEHVKQTTLHDINTKQTHAMQSVAACEVHGPAAHTTHITHTSPSVHTTHHTHHTQTS